MPTSGFIKMRSWAPSELPGVHSQSVKNRGQCRVISEGTTDECVRGTVQPWSSWHTPIRHYAEDKGYKMHLMGQNQKCSQVMPDPPVGASACHCAQQNWHLLWSKLQVMEERLAHWKRWKWTRGRQAVVHNPEPRYSHLQRIPAPKSSVSGKMIIKLLLSPYSFL